MSSLLGVAQGGGPAPPKPVFSRPRPNPRLSGGSWPSPGSRVSSLAPAAPGPPRLTGNPVGGAGGRAELPVWCRTDTWHSRLCPEAGEEGLAELPSLDQFLTVQWEEKAP